VPILSEAFPETRFLGARAALHYSNGLSRRVLRTGSGYDALVGAAAVSTGSRW
jgi:hypothetical protein